MEKRELVKLAPMQSCQALPPPSAPTDLPGLKATTKAIIHPTNEVPEQLQFLGGCLQSLGTLSQAQAASHVNSIGWNLNFWL